MHLRGDSVREIPFMLFLGLLFAVTVGWWVFLTLTVSVVFGNVAFVTTDPQGGSVHEVCDDPDFAEECDFQVVDTAGVLVGGVNDWCRAANLILVPMLPSTRDMEPTLRTLDIVRESGTGAKAYVIVNNFYAYGTLDRQLVEYLEGEGVPIIAKIPRAVALSRAAAAGVSVAEYDPKSHVVAPIELLADSVLNEEEKNNG